MQAHHILSNLFTMSYTRTLFWTDGIPKTFFLSHVRKHLYHFLTAYVHLAAAVKCIVGVYFKGRVAYACGLLIPSSSSMRFEYYSFRFHSTTDVKNLYNVPCYMLFEHKTAINKEVYNKDFLKSRIK